MSPKVDYSGTKTLEALPKAIYRARLSEFEFGETDNGPKIDMTFEVTDDHPDFQGRKLFRSHSLQPQALWASKQTFIALGADPEVFAGEVDLEDLLPDLVGNEVDLVVNVRKYEGEDRNEVRRVKRPGTAGSGLGF